jgi:hypothetical protein
MKNPSTAATAWSSPLLMLQGAEKTMPVRWRSVLALVAFASVR